jgi:sugar transferase (PEP-CTERM system associated)
VHSAPRHDGSRAVLLQLSVELCWLVAAVLLTLRFATRLEIAPLEASFLAFIFAVLIVSLNGALGLYRHVENFSIGAYTLRFILAPAIGVPLAYVIADALPGGESFQQHVGIVGLAALGGLLLVRHGFVLPLVRATMPHRVLVLGTGSEAKMVEASLVMARSKGIGLVGFYPLENGEPSLVAPNQVFTSRKPLEDLVERYRVDEIIVAVRQQRGISLPMRSLLQCRLSGIRITDLARFFERVHGRIPVDIVTIGWLVYGQGYRKGWLRTFNKRVSDVIGAVVLLILTAPLMAVFALLILLETGRPIVYRQTRVGRLGRHFTLLKFRSMRPDAEVGNGAQWADVNDPRVTRIGHLMRRTRIDELPQLINVLRGEMSLIGPRPERPEFVEMLSKELPFYAVRHSVDPGITGWAQVRYSYGATVAESRRKLEYDLYYVKNHSLVLDLQILLETVGVVLFAEGAR